MLSLRERSKNKRKDAILDAALELLEANTLDTVTIEQIAIAAEVSTPTVYNLIGTREQLFDAIMHRVIQELVDALSSAERVEAHDPLGDARFIVESTADAFIARGSAYRQILRLTIDTETPRSESGPYRLQVKAMRDAQALGLIDRDLDAEALGRQIYLSYIGAMYAWSEGVLDDEGFKLAAQHGLAAVVAGASSDEFRAEAYDEFRRLGVKLSKADWTG